MDEAQVDELLGYLFDIRERVDLEDALSTTNAHVAEVAEAVRGLDRRLASIERLLKAQGPPR